MERIEYEILRFSGSSYDLPIFLESSVDEMGVMVGFDGYIHHVEQVCNFTYTQVGSTVQIYNTADSNVNKTLIDQTYTVNWGDGSSSPISVFSGSTGDNLPTLTHTYSTNGEYTISILFQSPWDTQKTSKIVTIPQNITIQNPLGTFSGFNIPYTNITNQSYDYLSDLDYTNNTGHTIFKYIAIGGSRIGEKKLYGSNSYVGVTSGTDGLGSYSAYTIDNLTYKDYSDGYTMITGSTSAYTKEEVFNKIITRNEHFLGFVDEPTIYSDIFVERGKLGVMEFNLRLTEIDNTGELDVYGNGFYNVKKQ
jgi:hypothetical protein